MAHWSPWLIGPHLPYFYPNKQELIMQTYEKVKHICKNGNFNQGRPVIEWIQEETSADAVPTTETVPFIQLSGETLVPLEPPDDLDQDAAQPEGQPDNIFWIMASRRNFGARRKKEMAEQQKERRRAMQARHRATLAGLFDNLRNLVCPSEKAPAKWRILRQAKNLLLRQESYLEELLTMKEMFLPDEDGLCSLEEVREEYRRLHCQCRPPNTVTRCTRWTSKDLCSCARGETPCGGPGPGGIWDSDSSSSSSSSSEEELANVLDLSQSTSTSQSDIQEFEGYLRFYRQTVERLLGRGALRPEQTALAVVSDAILGLWHSLSPESRASFLPRSPEPSPLPWGSCSQEPPVPDPPAGSSQNSQGASGSSPSNFEEDLQDAYDVVQRDAHLSADKDSPARELQPREQRELYRHILSFMHTQPTQEVGVAADHDMGFLRCNETFDEDF